eukprot:CAMPEP_0180220586 /NCGR_PEP_ID=MMETSP0987-20121128/19216_1 /TAXON_ID=697907 /ORGANISM="non described non described, Strain CCMP2293" /LENGTH=148 /DNA_ID=CAMNT_0022181537 /DNA_START=437 /DNA_END=883 /DNA_ORIENTATION=-
MEPPSRLICLNPRQNAVSWPLKTQESSRGGGEGQRGYVVGVELSIAGVGANTRVVAATVAERVAGLRAPPVGLVEALAAALAADGHEAEDLVTHLDGELQRGEERVSVWSGLRPVLKLSAQLALCNPPNDALPSTSLPRVRRHRIELN